MKKLPSKVAYFNRIDFFSVLAKQPKNKNPVTPKAPYKMQNWVFRLGVAIYHKRLRKRDKNI